MTCDMCSVVTLCCYVLTACDSNGLTNCAECRDELLACDKCSSGYTATEDKTQCGGE